MSQMNVVLNKPIDGFNMNSEEGKMFVGGIKQDTTDEDFKEFFGKYGELTDCVLMKDQATNRPRGFGFIRYKDPSDVSKVLADAPHFLNGKRIDPKQCLPRNLSREMSRASGGRGMMGSGDAPLSQKIFIGGVGQTSEEDIQKAFSSYGNVLEVVLMMDKVTGNCRGFGFVTFDSEESVNELCSRQFVEILDKKVEIKKAQPRDSSGAPSGGGWSNSGPPGMNQGMGGPGGPPMGAWNQPQNQGGWNQNQGPGGQGGFNQQNNFGGNFQQGQGNYGGQQQQQQQQQPGQQGGWNQSAGQGGNGYGQQPQQNYGGNYGRQQQQQQPQANSYGGGQQSYGNYGGAYGQQQQQQQQPNMYGNQGGGDAQQAYGGQQQNYSNPQQQQQGQQQGQQANVGNNYAQEASGYGPTRVNSYNNAAGYNQPAGQGGAAYGQTAMAGNYSNGQQQQQQQQPMQQQPPQQQQQQRQPMQQQQQQPQQAMQQQPPQQQQGNYGQQPPGVGGPPGANYQQQQQRPGAPQQAQTFHPYRR